MGHTPLRTPLSALWNAKMAATLPIRCSFGGLLWQIIAADKMYSSLTL